MMDGVNHGWSYLERGSGFVMELNKSLMLLPLIIGAVNDGSDGKFEFVVIMELGLRNREKGRRSFGD